MGKAADEIEVLEGLEPIRRRPTMYVGPVDSPEVVPSLFEQTLCLALDDELNGRCTRIDVAVHPDGSISVDDDGPGLSVEVTHQGWRVAENLFRALGVCRAQRMNANVAKRFCGAGMAVVTALSEWLEVEIRRDGQLWTQRYVRGKAEARMAEVGVADRTGTCVRFKLDRTIIPAPIVESDLRARIELLRQEVPTTALRFVGTSA